MTATTPNSEHVYVAVGTSLGDRLAMVSFAAQTLSALPGIHLMAGSRLYDTAPVGGVAMQRFLNGVLRLEAAPPWDPESLLGALTYVESAAGRTRTERWEDRTLDLDLLLYGARCMEAPGLTIPHPGLHERRFVLEPLCDLAPEVVHPTLGRSLADLLAALAPDPDGCKALPIEALPEAWPPLPTPSKGASRAGG